MYNLSSLSYFVFRFSTGLMMCYFHGYGKLTADSERWYRLGKNITQFLSSDTLAIPLGFIASFSESIGALLIAIGLFTRPMAFLLGFTMIVASTKKLSEVGFNGSELPILYLILSLVILIGGSGKYGLDKFILKRKKY